MRISITLLLLLFHFATATAQDSIRHRIILVGDAGEIDSAQRRAMRHAAGQVIEGRTTVLFLGDNIYPRGMPLNDYTAIGEARDILRSQYEPMRHAGARVFMIPGNHDWEKSSPNGLLKIQAQGNFINGQGDSLLRFVPPDGCPDPVAIPVSDRMVIIAYDSEWWLYPFAKYNGDTDCDCRTKEDVIAKLDELFYIYRNKIIMLASHHPFRSYGVHGGRFTLKDHIFPLTNVNHNLYIPLPVIGSFYPALRKTFTNSEDLAHPLYKEMTNKISAVFDSFPNLVTVAGHEHGLQFIKGKYIQIVSGAGAKHNNVAKGPGSLYAAANQGYVVADLMTDNSLRFNFYTYLYLTDTITNPFTYTQPYTTLRDRNNPLYKPIEEDSVTVQVHPSYDKPGRFHRLLFGENYRKEWAAPTKLPVIHLSKIRGGLTPTELGGGMQSKSLRLKDKSGKEWVVRSVEKVPDALLPPGLRQSFARDWVDDVTSAQHPFSALIVPPIANAVKVPHAKPVIGVLSPDAKLGLYSKKFANLVVLLEEREPLGESDNTAKMKKKIQEDNDNRIHAKTFLRARMLDMFIGDWDRHEDQWRWYDDDKGKAKDYVPVPRDRDQVFHLTEGLLPTLASRDFILPTLRNFNHSMSKVKWLLYKTRFANAYPEMQFSEKEWMEQAEKFKAALTDSVLELALRQLPASAYEIRHDELLSKLKSRRELIPEKMRWYYRFTQKIVDIRTSDKNEYVQLTGQPGGDLNLRILKINKEGQLKDTLMDKTYDHKLTKELRIYVGDGKDSVVIDNTTSNICLRIIGGSGKKDYNMVAAKKKVKLYDRNNGSQFLGKTALFRKHISNDSLSTVYRETNLYSIFQPQFAVGLNIDDGLLLGAGFRLMKQEGFRKLPYTSRHQASLRYSFSTGAYRFNYSGEWISMIKKADLTTNLSLHGPANTMNFFGAGNETRNNKVGNHRRYYRTRFNIYELNAALRWRNPKKGVFSIGPSVAHYSFDEDDNNGRFIKNTSLIGTYDSATINKDKWHVGMVARYINDKRNNSIIPQYGTYVDFRIEAYQGIGSYARSFGQFIGEVALYKNLDARKHFIIADRFGGTVTVGDPAFYQLAFLGGHDNLLGYRQYRFGGQHSFYNNLEFRVKIADVASYVLPGQFGVSGFWDVGRVWVKHDNSGKWHNGTGAGIYFAPASLISFNFLMGYSKEGWYPYFTMGLRF